MNKVKTSILAIMILTVTATVVLLMLSLKEDGDVNASANEVSVSGNISGNSVSDDVIDIVIGDASLSADNASETEDIQATNQAVADPVEHDGKLSFVDESGHAFFTIDKGDFEYNFEQGYYHSMRSKDYFEVSYLTNAKVDILKKVYDTGACLEDMRDSGVGNPCLFYEKSVGELETPYGTMKIFKYCSMTADESGVKVGEASLTYWGMLPVEDKFVRFYDATATKEFDINNEEINGYFRSLNVPVNFMSYTDLVEAYDEDGEMYDRFVEKASAVFGE